MIRELRVLTSHPDVVGFGFEEARPLWCGTIEVGWDAALDVVLGERRDRPHPVASFVVSDDGASLNVHAGLTVSYQGRLLPRNARRRLSTGDLVEFEGDKGPVLNVEYRERAYAVLAASPLEGVMRELAALYGSGNHAELWPRIRVLRDTARPAWEPLWSRIYEGLCPESDESRGLATGEIQSQYRRARTLRVLSILPARPLAVAVLRKLGPAYWDDISIHDRRLVRWLGGWLDPKGDPETAALLVDLISAWEIDGKSTKGFLEALDRGGLMTAIAMLRRELCSDDQSSVETAARLLDRHPEREATLALRLGLARGCRPCALFTAKRDDLAALPFVQALDQNDASVRVATASLEGDETALRGAVEASRSIWTHLDVLVARRPSWLAEYLTAEARLPLERGSILPFLIPRALADLGAEGRAALMELSSGGPYADAAADALAWLDTPVFLDAARLVAALRGNDGPHEARHLIDRSRCAFTAMDLDGLRGLLDSKNATVASFAASQLAGLGLIAQEVARRLEEIGHRWAVWSLGFMDRAGNPT